MLLRKISLGYQLTLLVSFLRLGIVGAGILMLSQLAVAKEAELALLKSLDLEQLANQEIAIASKQLEPIKDIPAAVFVLNAEDIRRSSASSIPELLRQVPGIHVAQIDASSWAISARGFNGRYANKLLVLIDGRSVYSPVFSGVYWNIHHLIMEDIERIEVFRGPGAAIWGTNAVNGVINIITRSAEQTHGGLVSASIGEPESLRLAWRQGFKYNDNIDYRVFAKLSKNNHLMDAENGQKPARDDWRDIRAGFRLDGLISRQDSLSVQGNVYRNKERHGILVRLPESPYDNLPVEMQDQGGHLMASWQRDFDNDDHMILQTYVDYSERSEFNEDIYRFDLDWRYHMAPKQFLFEHQINVGLGFNYAHVEMGDFPGNAFEFKRTREIYSAFFQDKMRINDAWQLTLGAKLEQQDNSSFEFQPSLRLLWRMAPKHRIWGGISKASRTPSFADRNLFFNGVDISLSGGQGAMPSISQPSFNSRLSPLKANHRVTSLDNSVQISLSDTDGVTQQGNQQHDNNVIHNGINEPASVSIASSQSRPKSEKLIAYELGYRYQANANFYLDLALFYNRYSQLEPNTWSEINQFAPISASVFSQIQEPKVSANTWGSEIYLDWRFNPQWRLGLTYSFLKMDIDAINSNQNMGIDIVEQQSAKQLFSLGLSYRAHSHWETDLWLRYTDDLEHIKGKTPDYWSLDGKLTYVVNQNLQLSLVGRNLSDSKHKEYEDEMDFISHSQVPRSVSLNLLWRY